MAEDADNASKTEEASQHRLDEARRSGDVAKSADLAAFFALAAAVAVTLMSGPSMAVKMMMQLRPFIEHPAEFDVSNGGGIAVMRLALDAAMPAVVVMAVAAGAGAAGNFIQHGFLWTPAKLAPDLSKLNPLEGLKRMFNIDSLVQFGRNVAKLVGVTVIAWMVLGPRASDLNQLVGLDIAAILPVSMEAIRALAIAVLIVMGTLAGIDWFWTRFRFMQKMRMSREDLKQEHKDSDGDPHIKAKLRQMRTERSKKRMMQKVPTATLVVMNPTHYAVALRYEAGETPAPVCVAKGMDSLALKIREVAEANKVPVIEDPPLARALYATVEVDESIPREHYQAVAKVIGFIMGRRKPAARPGHPSSRAAPRPMGL